MNKLIKQVGALLGALVMVAAMSSSALAASKIYHPKDGNGILTPFEILGSSTGHVETSVTPKQINVGQGLLFGMCVYGTGAETVGKGAIAFDTSGTISALDYTYIEYAISPVVHVSSVTTLAGILNDGCWYPPVPKRFYKGLAVYSGSVGQNVMVDYRLDSLVNP